MKSGRWNRFPSFKIHTKIQVRVSRCNFQVSRFKPRSRSGFQDAISKFQDSHQDPGQGFKMLPSLPITCFKTSCVCSVQMGPPCFFLRWKCDPNSLLQLSLPLISLLKLSLPLISETLLWSVIHSHKSAYSSRRWSSWLAAATDWLVSPCLTWLVSPCLTAATGWLELLSMLQWPLPSQRHCNELAIASWKLLRGSCHRKAVSATLQQTCQLSKRNRYASWSLSPWSLHKTPCVSQTRDPHSQPHETHGVHTANPTRHTAFWLCYLLIINHQLLVY